MYIKCPRTKNKIRIYDLASSIKLANDFRKFGDENNELNNEIRNYWKDIYEQLLKL